MPLLHHLHFKQKENVEGVFFLCSGCVSLCSCMYNIYVYKYIV